MSRKGLALDYFAGGVPAGMMLKMKISDLREIVDASLETDGINTTAEVCLIGLVAYFESFCKDLFSSIINVCPHILSVFIEKRQTVSLDVKYIINLGYDVQSNLGFLLSEKYDFGSTKEINTLFMDLINISPISRDEERKFVTLLNDRNLLVHHGGVYTLKSKSELFMTRSIKNRVFYDSLVISKKRFKEWSDFIEYIAKKMCGVSYKALSAFIARENIALDNEMKKAVNYIKEYS